MILYSKQHMENINPEAHYEFSAALKLPTSHKSSLALRSPNPLETPASKLKKSMMKRVSSHLAGERAETCTGANEDEAAGDETSDPPSVLFIESDIEDSERSPSEDSTGPSCLKTPFKTTKVSTFAQCQEQATKTTEDSEARQIQRTLSGQLEIPKPASAKNLPRRSSSAKLLKVKIDDLPKLSEAYKDYLSTLFGSVCVVRRMRSRERETAPTCKIFLEKPPGLLCIPYYHTLANKTLVLDLDETLVHQTPEGEFKVSVPLDNDIYTEVPLN